MYDIKKYQDEPFSTFEGAELLGMREHKAQVVAWVRRHIKPFNVDKTSPKKKVIKLDLINIFELFLIKTLTHYNIRLGFIADILNREQITKLFHADNSDYIIIVGGSLFINERPMMFLKRSGSGSASIIVDVKKIKHEIAVAINRVRK